MTADALAFDVPPAGTVLAGKYRVERVIGSGGMGIVLATVHVHLGEPVALKRVHAARGVDRDAYERFFREARVASRIRSEHVARVFDLGTDEDGAPYIAMELLHGLDLATRVARDGALPVEEAVALVLQAIEGVAEAHACGVVHRDLKPANLFVTRRGDGSPCVKVLDFGVSKISGDAEAAARAALPPWTRAEPTDGAPHGALAAAADGTERIGDAPPSSRSASLTRSRARIGSPRYMAPEQMRSARDVDARADVWGLGTVLYELLAGAPPFDGATLDELLAAVSTKEPPPIEARRADVPKGLAHAIKRALRKEPADRFADVAEMAAAIAPFAPGGAEAATRAARILRRPRDVEGSETRTASTVASGDAAPSRTARRAVRATTSAAAIALVAAIGGAAAWRARAAKAVGSSATEAASAIAPATSPAPAQAAAAAHAPRVAAAIVGRGDAAWVGSLLTELVGAELGEADDLDVVDRDLVGPAARELPIVSRLDAASFAHATASDAALLATVRAERARLVVDGTLRRGDHDEPFAFDVADTDRCGAARRIAAALADAVGRTTATTDACRAYAHPVAALRPFAEALLAFDGDDRAGARVKLDEAVRRDPTFATAARWLAYDSYLLGWLPEARAAADRALAGAADLTQRQRLDVEAMSDGASKDWARAASTYAIRAKQMPASTSAALAVASALMRGGTVDELEAALPPLLASPDPRPATLWARAARARNDWVTLEQRARAALEHARALGVPSVTAQAQHELARALVSRSRWAEAERLFADARPPLDAIGNRSLTIRLLEVASDLEQRRGAYADAKRDVEEALALARKAADKRQAASLAYSLGVIHEHLGDWRAAIAYDEHARLAFLEVDDLMDAGRVVNSEAAVRLTLGDGAGAARGFREAERIARETHAPEDLALAIGNQALALLYVGQARRAKELAATSIEQARAIGSKYAEGIALDTRGMAAFALGDLDAAEADERRALETLAGYPSEQAGVRDNLSGVLEARGDRDGALREERLAADAFRAVDRKPAVAGAEIGAAWLLVDVGRVDEAESLAAAAIAESEAAHDGPRVALANAVLARVAGARRRSGEAARRLAACANGFATFDVFVQRRIVDAQAEVRDAIGDRAGAAAWRARTPKIR